ncbi:MAG: aconitate hydratase AcnA [Chloroflexi bacterium]|uniref:aconitate hydratase AcnA n=1 Tax=Candidatus Flexifilum breve TaxID=3140694 RepID=UPI0031352701|nr:aconitate hydratase AcnA [Chloroflexota bacterium]
MAQRVDTFGSRGTFNTGSGEAVIYRLSELAKRGIGHVDKLPYSIKILLENALRNLDNFEVSEDNVAALASWSANSTQAIEIPFKPSRVILQDFTGVATVVDLASLRSAVARVGANPRKINPIVPVDLVIDHSVQVDRFGSSDAILLNAQYEFERNRERYEFLHWGQKAFESLKVVPPATGIVHQVNIEYLAKVVHLRDDAGALTAFPDTLVGTDSHTTMINGLGVLGWGVGGIEAEAAMLGQPIYMLMPQVVGFKLNGCLPEGATATDLVLTITQMLRKRGVVDKFVEFFGPGCSMLTLPDRATIANMAPEYGATMGFFPIDDETLDYLRRTGRPEAQVQLVERYAKEQGLYRTFHNQAEYTDMLELTLDDVQPSMAGPKRPQDRVLLKDMKSAFEKALTTPIDQRGFALDQSALSNRAHIADNGHSADIGHGAVVIAAITSCTNTSNPMVMLTAGLLAKKAVEKGLASKPYVKTSLAPGSRVVTEYYDKAGLTPYLQALGFHTVGYGCTTCIGNSGPLPQKVSDAVVEGNLVAAAVLSGNRNFEGRINPFIKANYLASPPLVVAYALAGTVDIDLATEPIGVGKDGEAVYLKDIWPTNQEVLEVMQTAITPDMFLKQYGNVYNGNSMWNEIPSVTGDVFTWDSSSTYIQEPPFFMDFDPQPSPIKPIKGARALALLGDSITTDHISPAGDIALNSPAGKYLQERGIQKADFNVYGARRGNHEIMIRGTFANIRLRNQLVPGTEGGITMYLPTSEVLPIYDASQKYIADGTPLVVIAGLEYGTGSSRDWAAKGTALLGIKAVIARSYERIHRSNLVMMGVLPLQFKDGESAETLGLNGRETFEIVGIDDSVQPKSELTVIAKSDDGTVKTFQAIARIDTPVEVEYYRNGGILQTVLRKML